MGIPSYFYEIIKKYGDRFFGAYKGTRGVGRLFLDLNCCIHGCKNRVLNRWKIKYENSLGIDGKEIELGREFEDDVIKEVIHTIVRLSNEVSPINLLWIAVDGVVPLAKMKQQRERRLRAIQNRDEIRRIYECHERNPPLEWDSNAITPGTEFMNRMCKTIEENLETIRGYCGVKEIGMNGVNNPGEGEQKIFEYMRNYPGDDSELEDIIYGLDADLIILSILQRTVADQDSPIGLLRERVHYGKLVKGNTEKEGNEEEDEMVRFRVTEFADVIPKEWKGGSKRSTIQSLLCDYVILISIMGNDFVPHSPSVVFRTGGFERVIEAYCRVGANIIVTDPNPENDRYIIDWNVMGRICNILAEEEETVLREDEDKMTKIQERIQAGQIPYRHSVVEDPLEQDIIAMDWEHIRYHNPIIMKGERGEKEEKWVDSYYRRVVGNRGEWSSQNVLVRKMLEEYKKSIQWCWDYYCGYDVSADKYYPYVSGPLMRDIGRYFENYKIKNDDDDENEYTVINIPPEAQLIAVLPPQSHKLLPSSAKKIVDKWMDLYPEIFDFWDYCKKHEWEREGYLPIIPIKRIVDSLKEDSIQ